MHATGLTSTCQVSDLEAALTEARAGEAAAAADGEAKEAVLHRLRGEIVEIAFFPEVRARACVCVCVCQPHTLMLFSNFVLSKNSPSFLFAIIHIRRRLRVSFR